MKPGQLAAIQLAKIKVQLKGNELPFVIEGETEQPDHYLPQHLYRCGVIEASVLVYPIQLLERDGYIAARLLAHLDRSGQGLWGMFGRFNDWGEMRCHLVFPCAYALKHRLIVFDWRIEEWLEKTIMTI